jgi:dihydrofolate reductase
MEIKLIVACDNQWNIGKHGKLPWNHFKEDMDFFRRMTCDGVNPGVVMGRKTWESLPIKYRPLSNRTNIVISNTIPFLEGGIVARGFSDVIEIAKKYGIDKLWVIGGYSVYKDFIGAANELYITRIDKVFQGCDVKFPYKDINEYYVKANERKYITDRYEFTIERWLWDLDKVHSHCDKGK